MEMPEIDEQQLAQNFLLCAQIYKENNVDRLLYVCSICSEYFDEAIPLEQHVYEHFDEPVEGYKGIVDDEEQTTTIKIEIEGQSDGEQCETLSIIDEAVVEDNSEENTEHFNIDFDEEDDVNVDGDAEVEGADNIEQPLKPGTNTIQFNESKKFQIKCSCCENSRFPCFGLLKEHNVQLDKGEHECTYSSECVAAFQQSDDLLKHIEHHQRADLFLCDYCGKVFASEIELELHYGTRVGDLTTFASEKMKTANELAVQSDVIVANVTRGPTIRTEHDNQVYICDICAKMFEHYSEIKQHMKQFHDAYNISELQLKCNICFQQFQWRKDYEQHMEVHATNEIDKQKLWTRCKYCPKRFRQTKRLQAHMKTHSRCDGLFTCTICSKTFKTRENLQQHERIHTGMWSRLRAVFSEIILVVCSICFQVRNPMSVQFVISVSITRRTLIFTCERIQKKSRTAARNATQRSYRNPNCRRMKRNTTMFGPMFARYAINAFERQPIYGIISGPSIRCPSPLNAPNAANDSPGQNCCINTINCIKM